MRRAGIAALLLLASLQALAQANEPVPDEPVDRGIASWYGARFQGRRTASGEKFDMHALTAAHPTLPSGSPPVGPA